MFSWQHQPYAAIFINCGGTEDLVRLLGAGPHARLFVIDCHRPVHLANIRRDNHKVSTLTSDTSTAAKQQYQQECGYEVKSGMNSGEQRR